ncbi:TetR/AcrR family transcriptional regulator [Streptosporangium sp. NBC_01755]|uniref:TetR/AcrR family transcriptional regulator n=1 Tax=unclassified Streptosporangium TaxID=2632669 RepID=UPI002DDBF3A5|nr:MULTISPECIES: TetR/AcrR family transcriptional regulator [unclassified Streptosporangium]WSA27986.1 TetR/AcrR family transcriptional regulator [Streptosporangium sp. NBC_01810]WSD00543.1 TetR/AcrR family transcriptional regulator [Streptosporangium sp. NBC_01755]
MPRQADTRVRARDEFARLLAERGYLGVSLDEIAKTVDVKKASLYHHFPGGKPALFMEVAHHYIEETSAALQRALGGDGDLRDRLLALADTYARGTYNSALGDQIYYATRHLDDAQRADVSHAYVRSLITPVTDLMAQAVETGELRKADPSFLAMAFMELAGMLQPMPADVAMPPQERPVPPPADQLVHEVVDLFLRGAAVPDRPMT